ncbi:MAG: enoyl-CoA hydratase-related protein [Caulobacterales bacterium]|nr:enoyl-CoA hydratase-related protein [Caulobacterales bacterium]
MSDGALLYRNVSDHVALVTINRPGALNAVNGEVAQGVDAAVKASEADPDLWAVVLTGAGEKAFSAGADLKALAAGEGASLATPDGGFGGLTRAERSTLWIAAVNGLAVGGGCELALSCDLIVASEEASFGLPEVKRGLAAFAGGMFRLPRALPRAVAMELIVTGESLPARRALELGLVNRLAPPGEAAGAAIALAETVCGNAPLSVRESMKVARMAYDLDEEALWAMSDAARRVIVRSEDFKEGARAFVEKRAPVWKGR